MASLSLPAPAGSPAVLLHRAIRRWHFCIGLIILPVLAWLSATGALFLYKPEIERIVYARWLAVDPALPPLPLATLRGRVEMATHATVTQIARPAARAESWRLTLALADGTRRTAFVDPHDGRVFGTTRPGGAMQAVRELHSLVLAGPIANALVEIAAGWAVVLVLTGAYLWWPRRGWPAVALRGSPSQRLWWRDLHATTGFVAGGALLFLALSGMPWSVVWGRTAQDWVATHGLGRPPAPAAAPLAHPGHDAAETLPWSLQRGRMPHGGGDRIGPDGALAAAAARGLHAPWVMTLPAGPGAPYLVSAGLVRAGDAHVVYVDPADGRVLVDAPFARFGAGAKLFEWTAAVHMGQEYGEPNRLAMLAACVATLLLCLSAPILWLKRRRPGRLDAPQGQAGPGLLALMAVAGALFPLTGLTMAAALGVEALVVRRGRQAVGGAHRGLP